MMGVPLSSMPITFGVLFICFKVSAAASQGNSTSGMTSDSYCDLKGLCGPNGNCDLNKSPACVCLDGFTPKSPSGWDSMDYTQGCVLEKPLNCPTDGFVRYSVVKTPSGTYWSNQSLTKENCREKCFRNCSCVAYTAENGCKLWSGNLFDVRVVMGGGQDLYIRMPASELGHDEAHNGRERKIVGVIVGITVAIISAMLLGLYYMRRRILNLKGETQTSRGMVSQINDKQEEDLGLPLLDLSIIIMATNNFSTDNKLGEGGFGPVYKGILNDGQEIATKRLSSSSRQGLNEFKNEITLIAKLQHRNLVKLLGCCIQDEETLLIYEYMPNKSLDYFIFDETRRKFLDWTKRFNIICGIAKGLLYLHHDSRLRIIHRDLKASNVLLDSEMNPKISDFGLAKTFGGDQSKGNTRRVVGTYGYMAPEYAVYGHFSIKSDVFSFGILLLEIVTGRKNKGFYCPDDDINLIGHAWNLWKDGRSLELVDEWVKESCNLGELLRCIHISLLCVQQHPQDRPSMSSVVLMLGSEIELPQPKFPGYFIGEPSKGENSSTCTNELSITVLEAR